MAIDFGIVAGRMVADAYRRVFGDQFRPDDQGVQFWTQQLASGNIAPGRLVSAMAASAGRPDPSVNDELMQDLSYASFLRGAGLQESEIESGLASIKDRIARDRNIAESRFADERTQRAQAVDDSFESRGLFASGARLSDLARSAAEVDRSAAEYGRGLADQQANAEADAASQLAALRRRQVEEQQAARVRLTQRDGGLG